MSEKQFEDIFTMLDLDKDGKISFQDWTKSIGPEIHPSEALYFRQDLIN